MATKRPDAAKAWMLGRAAPATPRLLVGARSATAVDADVAVVGAMLRLLALAAEVSASALVATGVFAGAAAMAAALGGAPLALPPLSIRAVASVATLTGEGAVVLVACGAAAVVKAGAQGLAGTANGAAVGRSGGAETMTELLPGLPATAAAAAAAAAGTKPEGSGDPALLSVLP